MSSADSTSAENNSTPFRVAVQITGWHPRWRKISSVQAIRQAADCGLAQAKMIVDTALAGHHACIDVQGLEKAKLLAKELADLGAITFCAGHIFDSFPGEAGEIPYRLKAAGTLRLLKSQGSLLTADILRGSIPRNFELSLPLNGSLDIRVRAKLVEITGQTATIHANFENAEEAEFWHALSDTGDEIDVHEFVECFDKATKP